MHLAEQVRTFKAFQRAKGMATRYDLPWGLLAKVLDLLSTRRLGAWAVVRRDIMFKTKWLFCLGLLCVVVVIANAEVGQQLHAKRPGNSSFIDDFTTELPPHLRVSFVLTEMSHDVVSGGGVQGAVFVRWENRSTAATKELYSYSAYEAPNPGSPLSLDFPIYDGFVHDGCGNTPVFPISFHSWVLEDYVKHAVLGEFSATDNSTIQPNGFWTFAYTIRATDSHGGVSDYTFRGTVSATCTNLDSFD
jgi:hypothetical protein